LALVIIPSYHLNISSTEANQPLACTHSLNSCVLSTLIYCVVKVAFCSGKEPTELHFSSHHHLNF
jgi:hypothetical protein